MRDPVARRAIWERDGGLCGFCTKPVRLDRMHLDHIQPRSYGGTNAAENLRPSHPSCNIGASASQRRGRSFTPIGAGSNPKIISGKMPAELWNRIDALATQIDRSFNATCVLVLELGLTAREAEQRKAAES